MTQFKFGLGASQAAWHWAGFGTLTLILCPPAQSAETSPPLPSALCL